MTAAAGTRDNMTGVDSFTAPTGGVTVGKIYKIGDSLVVANETAAAAAAFAGSYKGRVWAVKLGATGISFAIGAKCYADLTNHRITTASTGNTLVPGRVAVAAAATDTVVCIELIGESV